MKQSHYYGDRVRDLFITGAIIMTLTLPFFNDLLPQPIFFSILSVLLLIILSGYLSPRYKGLVAASVPVSAGAFLIFEYYAIQASQEMGVQSLFFVINQSLALVFLFAVYYATKSTRWLNQKDE